MFLKRLNKIVKDNPILFNIVLLVCIDYRMKQYIINKQTSNQHRLINCFKDLLVF